MKTPVFLIIFSLLLSQIYSDTIPAEVTRGIQAMENPKIPYADFLKAKQWYKDNQQIDIEFEHIKPYTRPTSFYSGGVYNSKRLMYYTYFASYGYCYPETIAAGQCCTKIVSNTKGVASPNGWTLIDYGRSSDTDTHLIFTHKKNTYAILRSDIFKKVIITFPGTKDQVVQLGSELINSVLVTPTMKSMKGDIKINKYFDARSFALIDIIFSETNRQKMKLADGYQVIFTGHSLGGAMAAVSLFFAVDRGYITRTKNKPVLITYGQPRAGNEAFALAVNNNAEVIYRNVNSMDIVTQIPLYGDGNRHTVGEINIDGDNNSYSINKSTEAYNVNSIKDSQKYDLVVLIKYLINNLDRHLYYYKNSVSGICDNNNNY